MAKNRWIWVGCGGCLGLIILAVLLSIALGTVGYRYAKNIQNNMEVWDTQKREINQAFPFTPPGDHQIPEERYEDFLRVRKEIIVLAEKRLDWLFDFIQSGEKPGKMDMLKLGFKFLHFFSTFSEIGSKLTETLRNEQMSMDEYAYLTRLTMGTLHSWKENEEDTSKKAVWDRYMQPIYDLKDKTDKIEEEKPGANIDLGPLDKNTILGLIDSFPTPPAETETIVFTHRDQISSVSSSVFVDIFIVEN